MSAVDPVTGALHMSDDEWDQLVQCFERMSEGIAKATEILTNDITRTGAKK